VHKDKRSKTIKKNLTHQYAGKLLERMQEILQEIAKALVCPGPGKGSPREEDASGLGLIWHRIARLDSVKDLFTSQLPGD
jgi:hypothetical protein